MLNDVLESDEDMARMNLTLMLATPHLYDCPLTFHEGVPLLPWEEVELMLETYLQEVETLLAEVRHQRAPQRGRARG